MQITVNIKKRHLATLIIILAIFSSIMIGTAVDVNLDKPWHILSQVARSDTDQTSVDEDKNGQVDHADNADSVDWSGITSMPGDIADGDNQNLANVRGVGGCTDCITGTDIDQTTLPDTDPTNEIQGLGNVLTQSNSAGNNQITNLQDPTNNQDAATKNYVDNKVYTQTVYGPSTTASADWSANCANPNQHSPSSEVSCPSGCVAIECSMQADGNPAMFDVYFGQSEGFLPNCAAIAYYAFKDETDDRKCTAMISYNYLGGDMDFRSAARCLCFN